MANYGDDVETVLETGHVLMHCKHGQEYCALCCRDFRGMNQDARRESAAEIAAKTAKREQRQVRNCGAEGCQQVGGSIQLCSRCRAVGYCSESCQKKDWPRHKTQCKTSLPKIKNSLTGKEITTFPIGTELKRSNDISPFTIKILKYNPPGTSRAADSSSENLATYTVKDSSTADNDGGEVWEEVCEDVHCHASWKMKRY